MRAPATTMLALQLVVATLAAADTGSPARPAAPQAAAAPAPPPPKGPAPAVPPKATAPVVPPIFSPFGPGYDTNQPPPTEPTESGPGITDASLAASGAAEVEELTAAGAATEQLFAVALDVTLAAASTTVPLSPASVFAKPEKGDAIPLFAVCTPTLDLETSLFRPLDAGLAAWHIAAGGKTWFCGGRTARMVKKLRQGGIRLVNTNAAEWKGPLVLLFHCAADLPREIVLPGRSVKLPPPGSDAAPAH